MAVVEYSPTMLRALGSIPSIGKKIGVLIVVVFFFKDASHIL
jgi:hypothetical protein